MKVAPSVTLAPMMRGASDAEKIVLKRTSSS